MERAVAPEVAVERAVAPEVAVEQPMAAVGVPQYKGLSNLAKRPMIRHLSCLTRGEEVTMGV